MAHEVNRAARWALREANRHRREFVRRRNYFTGFGWLVIALSSGILLIAFAAGVYVGRPHPPKQTAEPRSLSTADAEREARLLADAAAYADFCEAYQARLAQTAQRRGWSPDQLRRALQLVEKAAHNCAAIREFYAGWEELDAHDRTLLKGAVDLLVIQLDMTLCTEFRLACVRGVPPDQAPSIDWLQARPSGDHHRRVFLYPYIAIHSPGNGNHLQYRLYGPSPERTPPPQRRPA